MNRIMIDDLHETENGYNRCVDQKTKNLFEGSEGEFVGRKDLLILELPTLEKMDPVGWAAYLETWKVENPLIAAMLESLPIVIELKEKIKPEMIRPFSLIEKKREHKPRGKQL